MKKLLILSLILFIKIQSGYSQGLMESTKDALRSGQKISSGADKMLYGIPREEGIVLGDNYLDTTFVVSNIMLFKEEKIYANIPSRLDVKNNILEIKTPMGVRVLDGIRVKFFSVTNALNHDGTIFLNTQNFKGDSESLNGFFELISEGNSSLIVYNKAWEKKATYNEALGAGDINAKIIKEKHYYISIGDKVKKIGNSKKSIIEALPAHRQEMEKFLKEGDFSYKSIPDLIKIVTYYNQISSVK